MFFKKDNLLELARQEYVRLLRENAELQAEVMRLREPAKIAKEAVDRFCSREMIDGAYRWLREQGI